MAHSFPQTRYPYPETDHYPPPPGISSGDRYVGGRTPSPTPSEVEASENFFNWKKYSNWRFWARKDWIVWYIVGTVLIVVTILISVFDKQIVKFLTPAGQWMRRLPFGWLIPIAILFVISFPPLFGHEIVAILVGVIWGIGVGFAIVAAGTFVGEVGNYYAFKYCCRARGEKMEKNSIMYGALARVVREGGFKMALIIRLSVIPGHFSTAVFSTCGMSIFIFALAAFFSLPKQLITVYIGVILEESGTGTTTKKDKIISDAVLGATILMTVLACWYVWREINRVKPAVIYERRKARQAKLTNVAYGMDNGSTAMLNPLVSDAELPLSVNPMRPPNFNVRHGTSGYAGYGGYTPSYIQGRYGESLEDEERKSIEVGWETRGARVADMRGRPLGGVSKPGHASDEDDSEDTPITVPRLESAYPPPPLPPPGFERETAYQPQPSRQQGYALQSPPTSAPLPNPFSDTPHASQHRFEISDPPVTSHTPQASDSTYPYPPSHALSHDPSLYTHSPEPSNMSYGSEYPLTATHRQEPTNETFLGASRGHAAEPTDASYYTAAASPPASSPPVVDSQPPRNPPGRTS